jgi:hypothetical protein
VSNNIEPAFARQPSVKDKGVVAKKSNVVNKIEEYDFVLFFSLQLNY